MNSSTFKTDHFKLAHTLALGLLALAANPANATDYSFSDLGTMTGPYVGYGANGVNNLGQASGYGNDASGVWAAIRWNSDTATALPYGTGGESGLGIGINNAGQIAGYNSHPVAEDQYDAIRWDGGTAVTLDNLGFGYFSAGLGINDQGQVVGES